MRQIAANAGQDGAVVVQNVRGKKSTPKGYNAGADRYRDHRRGGRHRPTRGPSA
jgi:chaperonin GroEL